VLGGCWNVSKDYLFYKYTTGQKTPTFFQFLLKFTQFNFLIYSEIKAWNKLEIIIKK